MSLVSLERLQSALNECLSRISLDMPDRDREATFCVNVSLYRGGKTMGCYGANSPDLETAATHALGRALEDPRFGSQLRIGETENVSLVISALTSRSPLFRPDDPALHRNLTKGLCGLRLVHADGSSYFLPHVAIIHRARDPIKVLDQLRRKARRKTNDTFQFALERWNQVLWHQGKVFPLHRHRVRKEKNPDKAGLKAAVQAAVAHLCANQGVLGHFTYAYDPLRAKAQKGIRNIVRQAGAFYGLAAAREVLDPAQALRADAAIKNAAHFLQSRMHRISGGLFIYDEKRREAPLGASALLLLGLCHLPEIDARAMELAAALSRLRRPDGSFPGDASKPEEVGHQDYAPGEILFALCHYALRTGDVNLLHSLPASFPFYRNHFRTAPAPGFVLWHVCAWSRYCLAIPTPEIRAFVFELLDWVLQFQYVDSDAVPEDYVGGVSFSRGKGQAMPGVGTTVYVEALAYGYEQAVMAEDATRAARYRKALILGLHFCQQLQITEPDTFCMVEPEYAVGGVTKNLISYEMRCDNAQHLITAYLKVLSLEILD